MGGSATDGMVKGLIDLSFSNAKLYVGCDILKVSPGKFKLRTPPFMMAPTLRANLEKAFTALKAEYIDEVTLAGHAPHWVFTIAGAVAAKHFGTVWYTDGDVTISVL